MDLTYLCLQSQKVAFQHAPVVPQGSHVSMESAFSGAELQSTLYHTEPGVRQGDGRTGEPMFAFAIKVSADTSKNIKVKKFICLSALCTSNNERLLFTEFGLCCRKFCFHWVFVEAPFVTGCCLLNKCGSLRYVLFHVHALSVFIIARFQ